MKEAVAGSSLLIFVDTGATVSLVDFDFCQSKFPRFHLMRSEDKVCDVQAHKL